VAEPIVTKHFIEITLVYSAYAVMLLVLSLGQRPIRVENPTCLLKTGKKLVIFKVMERVVMNEGLYGPLCWEVVRHMLKNVAHQLGCVR
jgi:hypothetical protein